MSEKTLTRALLETAMRRGMADHPELHQKWIIVQQRFSALAGGNAAVLMPFAMNARVDMLLRTLEAENLQRLPGGETHDIEFADDLFISLSQSWVSRTYELMRIARESLDGRSEKIPQELASLLYQLELVRIPIDKAEIKKPKGVAVAAMKSIVLTLADGSEPKPYQKGHFILPPDTCPQTGAIMWRPIDLKMQQTVEVCRRDLSDWLLGLFD